MGPLPPRARERGHGLVGVDHANSLVIIAADDDEVLPVFDDGSDAVRRFAPRALRPLACWERVRPRLQH